MILPGALLCISIYNKVNARRTIDQKIALLPAFSFATMDDEPFASGDLNTFHGRVIINYFSPDCEHCQYMARSFCKNADRLGDVLLVMVTIADRGSLARFRQDYHLDSIPHILFLRDSRLEFEKIFGMAVVPSFYCYKGGRLQKKIIGETKFENLLNQQ